MPAKVMDRRASDNEYLHRDFHGALSSALIYLEKRFGPEAVAEYLASFAEVFYQPLREELRSEGLTAIADHLQDVYGEEGAEVQVELTADELVARVDACPAVTHMRTRGYEVSPLWHQTLTAVNEAICDGSGYTFELLDYEPETGASVCRFYRPETGGEGEAR
jgi:hypothetical protein